MGGEQMIKVNHPGMVSAEKALELVLKGAGPAGAQTVPLVEAAGRVLAEDLASKRTQPPFPASAMDGYAVRHVDLGSIPCELEIVGISAAGHPFTGATKPGQCVRIYTGAPVPKNLDTIIIQEETTRQGGAAGDKVKVLKGADKGAFVRPAGLDFSTGDQLLRVGVVIGPQALALAASMDHGAIPVYARPRVAILATGDELVLPGEAAGPGQIIASNTFGVAAIARDGGAQVIDLGIAADTIEDLERRIGGALEAGADLIVTTGGVSVGDHDLVKPVMAKLGFTFEFEKIAMRPGKPVTFGTAEIGGAKRRFLGLAGNPVSSLVSGHILMRPLIRLLGGYPAETVRPVPAVLSEAMAANDKRQDYVRATAKRGSDGGLIITPFARQDSSMLATLAKSDCLIIRPPLAPAIAAGSPVDVIVLRAV